jgi:hypothetical protein
MTKSGRSVQKPTTFVPPTAPSPTTNPTHKRKRVFTRRNPESAVCKVCLRGTSPTSNMIVFCDGCNSPYHRFCHQPAIEQSVVDVVDKEWFCRRCVVEREEPVPEGEVSGFVAVEGVSVEQVSQNYGEWSGVMRRSTDVFEPTATTILRQSTIRDIGDFTDQGNDHTTLPAGIRARLRQSNTSRLCSNGFHDHHFFSACNQRPPTTIQHHKLHPTSSFCIHPLIKTSTCSNSTSRILLRSRCTPRTISSARPGVNEVLAER